MTISFTYYKRNTWNLLSWDWHEILKKHFRFYPVSIWRHVLSEDSIVFTSTCNLIMWLRWGSEKTLILDFILLNYPVFEQFFWFKKNIFNNGLFISLYIQSQLFLQFWHIRAEQTALVNYVYISYDISNQPQTCM